MQQLDNDRNVQMYLNEGTPDLYILFGNKFKKYMSGE